MDDVLNKYYDYLKYELNYSDLTISDYQQHLGKYKEYLNERKLNYLKVNKDDVIEMLKYLDGLKLSIWSFPIIFRLLISSINCFLNNSYFSFPPV